MTSKQAIQLDGVITKAHFDFEKKLNHYAYIKVHNHAISEDLVQDTFIKTWRFLVRGGKIETMKAFLYHVLNNLIVDEYRKHKTISLDVLLGKGFEPSAGDPKRFIDVLGGREAILLVKQIPEKFQKVIKMRFVQDLSLKEISLITGQTKNTIAVQIHRGLAKLKLLYA